MNMNLQFFGGRGSAAGKRTGASSSGNVKEKVLKNLNDFVNNYDISERSREYDKLLADTLEELPVGSRIYTGSTTSVLGATIDGKRVTGDQATFYEKVKDQGRYSTYRLFGSNDYDEVYEDKIRKELARGKRLGKLKLSIK